MGGSSVVISSPTIAEPAACARGARASVRCRTPALSGDGSDDGQRQLAADDRAGMQVVAVAAIAELVDLHLPCGIARKGISPARVVQGGEAQLVPRSVLRLGRGAVQRKLAAGRAMGAWSEPRSRLSVRCRTQHAGRTGGVVRRSPPSRLVTPRRC